MPQAIVSQLEADEAAIYVECSCNRIGGSDLHRERPAKNVFEVFEGHETLIEKAKEHADAAKRAAEEAGKHLDTHVAAAKIGYWGGPVVEVGVIAVG